MKTENLIALLATDAGPAPRLHIGRGIAPVLAAGLVASVAVSLAVRGHVPTAMWSGAAAWIKLAYAGSLAGGCGLLAARLARPAAPIRLAVAAVAAAVMVMVLAGALALSGVAAPDRARAILGHTALICPWAIALLSLPTLAGLIWILRDFAPTRPRLAGLAAGLLAGAVGAAGYALSCTEETVAFIAVWYSAGIALSGGLGALVGGRFLRW